ncbi:MAG: VOC family protein [Pseudomonadota bacterium]
MDDPGIDRVNLYVSDLERSMTFFGDVLGFQAGAIERHAPGSFAHDLMDLGTNVTLRETVLRLGDSDSVLGLVEADGVAKPDTAGTAVRIEVRSLDSAIAGAERLGLTVMAEHEAENAIGQSVRQRVVVDWDGNRIALYDVVANQALVVGDCVVVGDLLSWKVFDDRQIYIEGTEAGTRLLLTTRARCRGALYSRLFEIPNSEGRLCRTGSRIAYLDAGLRRTCRIDNFELVRDIDEASTRAKERRSAAQYQ